MAAQMSQQTVQLGPKGPRVPALGIGTWAWGDSLFWQYGKDYGRDEVKAAFEASLAAGVNFFDTAEVYGLGESEKLLGQFIQDTEQPTLVATKYFPVPWRFSEQAVADALTASLKRLQVSSVTLYQVHQPFSFFMSQETLMNALADEVKQGRIAAVGVSNYSAQQMREAHSYLAQRGIPLAANQVSYSLLNRKIETNGILEAAWNLEMTILAYSPLSQGLLTGKYSPDSDQKPSGARSLNPRFSRDGLRKIEPVIQTLKAIGEARDRTPAQVALNWLINQGNVIPIPGAKNASQAEQNAGALGWSVSPEEQEKIAEVTAEWRT